MLFQSYVFIFAFLPVTLAGFILLSRLEGGKFGLAWLTGASAFFYAWYVPVYLALLAASVVVNFLIARHLFRTRSRAFLILGIAANLGALAFFKYGGFFVTNLNALLDSGLPAPKVVLPLAISFFTFQQIAYLVDVYRGETKYYGILHYALFVTFFPQLIAGPIVHHAEVMPQFKRMVDRHSRRTVDLAVGLTIFSLGLFKKIVIADSVGVFADIVFNLSARGYTHGFIEAWTGAIAYTLQIYFDFSGYSDMAVGLARMFGVVLPVNFFSPYRSTNIIDFWRRWHITLSRFLRVYLYFSLGGNRKGPARRYVNLMTVMLLGGLWHGAGWNFVIWGGLHGLFLVVNHAFRRLCEAVPALRLPRLLAGLITLTAVTAAWVPFRAASLDSSLRIWQSMLGLNGVNVPRTVIGALGSFGQTVLDWGIRLDSTVFRTFVTDGGMANALWLPGGLAIALLAPNVYQWMGRFRPALTTYSGLLGTYPRWAWRPTYYWAVVLAAVALISVGYQTEPVEFLYFQF